MHCPLPCRASPFPVGMTNRPLPGHPSCTLATLQVDQCLEQFIESLQATSGLRSKQQALVQVQVQEEQQVEEALAAAEEQDLGDQGLAGIEAPERPQSPEPWGIIPRQLPQYKVGGLVKPCGKRFVWGGLPSAVRAAQSLQPAWCNLPTDDV